MLFDLTLIMCYMEYVCDMHAHSGEMYVSYNNAHVYVRMMPLYSSKPKVESPLRIHVHAQQVVVCVAELLYIRI